MNRCVTWSIWLCIVLRQIHEGNLLFRIYMQNHFALVLALFVVVLNAAVCKAVEPPTVAQFRLDHLELRRAVSNVQGDFHVFRSETVLPRALDELPSDLDIPLIRKGSLWRSTERFRADYRSFRPSSKVAKESQHSVARDGGKVYELSSVAPDSGMLRVCDMDTPEAAVSMKFIEFMFYQPLDALWSGGGGTPFVDMLQRPDAKIVPNTQKLVGGFSMLVTADDWSESRYEFESSKNHPLGYCFASDGGRDSLVKAERRVFSAEQQGEIFPTRVVNVVALGRNSGYTEVFIFDLKPLESRSPIASELTAASFQDLGTGYQVYNFRRSAKEEIAERYDAPATPTASSVSKLRSYFLWLNGLLVLALLAYILYRRGRNKNRVGG